MVDLLVELMEVVMVGQRAVETVAPMVVLVLMLAV